MTSTPSDGGMGSGSPSFGQTVRWGLRWSLVAQVVIQLGSISATVILARVLVPAEFGIVALAQSVLGVTALVSLAGVNAALVTRRGEIERAASTFFWLTASLGAAFVLLAFTLAGPLTRALGQAGSGPYVAVLSLSFALEVLALVPFALLQRRLSFGWMNAAQLAGATTYFGGEVVLALAGNGAWSVIVAQVAGSAVTLVCALAGARWRPRHRPGLASIRDDLRLTAGLSVAQLLAYVQKNVDYWAVSRIMGAATLGVYYIAYVIPNILRLRVSTAMRQVLVPAFAAAGTEGAAAAIWRQSLPLVFGLGVPTLVGLAVVAPEVVAVFFGPSWSEAVGPLQVLTIGTTVDLVMTSVAALATARRLMRPYLVVLTVRAVATAVLATFAARQLGTATSVAWAVSGAAVLSLVVQELVLSPRLGVSLRGVAAPALGYLALSAAMAVVLVAVDQLVVSALAPVVRLVVLVPLGTLVYVGLGRLLLPRLITPVVVEVRRVALGR